jgi:signal transduction histidine kinase/ActR/RegA family two-component response regulator
MTGRILKDIGVTCEACRDVPALRVELEKGAGAVVLTEEMLESAQITALVAYLREQPPWSDLPILLLASGGATSQAGLRALNVFRNVTVLERPVRTASLVSVVRTLLRGRQWQYQIRGFMEDLSAAAREREQLLRSELAARAEAERVSRVKDEFLATLSHELRTPLNAILGWSQLLRTSEHQNDLEEGLSTIERNARVQTQIIEDLLDMSRIISGRIRLDVQRVELIGVIEAALDTVYPAADAKEIRIEKILDQRIGPISGDPSRLQQVFWNLLSNAIKFTPRGGRVQLVLERVDSHIEISVIDTGEGISADFLPHIFERFRQGDPSTTRRHGGLGLGLAIVKQLVELHGGTIRAKSAGLKQGTTFTVALPLTIVHPEPEPVPHRRHPKALSPHPALSSPNMTLKGIRVLVVDDEPDARALVKRVLEDCQATVQTASSAAEALEAVRQEPPTVLISDIGMPEEDGYALIRKVRALDKSRGAMTPALALTAYARTEDRMQAIRNGYQMHIAKPVEPAELTTVVAALAGRTSQCGNEQEGNGEQ